MHGSKSKESAFNKMKNLVIKNRSYGEINYKSFTL